jgi:hypothetical protein
MSHNDELDDGAVFGELRESVSRLPMATAPSLEVITARGRACRGGGRVRVGAGFTAAAAATAGAAAVLAISPGAVTAQHAPAGHARTVVTAAWTVRKDADGTVTVNLKQVLNGRATYKLSINQALLEQTLKADGVNAIIRQVPLVPQGPVKLPPRPGNPHGITWNYSVPACEYNKDNYAPKAVQKAVVVHDSIPTFDGGWVIRSKAMPPGSVLFIWFENFPGPNGGYEVHSPVVLNNATLPRCVPLSQLAPPVRHASGFHAPGGIHFRVGHASRITPADLP